MVDLTSLGGVAVLTLVTLFAAGFLMCSRKPALALFVLASVGGGALGGTLLKSLFLRARPDVVPHLVQVDSASFPSGHAMNSAVVYLTLGALLARLMADWRIRAYLLLVSMLLVVLIGFTRVYVGVHWPTDGTNSGQRVVGRMRSGAGRVPVFLCPALCPDFLLTRTDHHLWLKNPQISAAFGWPWKAD